MLQCLKYRSTRVYITSWGGRSARAGVASGGWRNETEGFSDKGGALVLWTAPDGFCWPPYWATSGASLPGQKPPGKRLAVPWEFGVPPAGVLETGTPLEKPPRGATSACDPVACVLMAGDGASWESMCSSNLRPRDCKRASILLTLASSSSPKPMRLPGFCLSR